MKPYRKVINGILLYKGKVLCEKLEYIKLPGGGLDKGESPKTALIREVIEETGARVKSLQLVETFCIEWNEEWVNNEPKKRERFKQFRGEEVYMFVGEIKEFGDPTSQEGDQWGTSGADVKRKHLHSIGQILPVIEKQLKSEKRNKNFDVLYVSQVAILKTLQLVA